MLPLRPDPDASRDVAMRSLVRAAIATCRSALDRGVRPDKFVARTWPDDRGAPLILRGSVEPLTRDDAARRWGRCRDSPFTKGEFGSLRLRKSM